MDSSLVNPRNAATESKGVNTYKEYKKEKTKVKVQGHTGGKTCERDHLGSTCQPLKTIYLQCLPRL